MRNWDLRLGCLVLHTLKSTPPLDPVYPRLHVYKSSRLLQSTCTQTACLWSVQDFTWQVVCSRQAKIETIKSHQMKSIGLLCQMNPYFVKPVSNFLYDADTFWVINNRIEYLRHILELRKSIILKITTMNSILWNQHKFYLELNSTRAITQHVGCANHNFCWGFL